MRSTRWLSACFQEHPHLHGAHASAVALLEEVLLVLQLVAPVRTSVALREKSMRVCWHSSAKSIERDSSTCL